MKLFTSPKAAPRTLRDLAIWGLAFRLCGAALLLTLVSACGGGGGGDDDDDDNFIGAALVAISANPGTIDTGDRTRIETALEQVHENGILLKFKLPKGLEYVIGSGELVVDGSETAIEPSIDVVRDSSRYIVFFIEQSKFSSERRGDLNYQLKASAKVPEGKVEVDADVNDPLISDNEEFQIETPEFAAEDSVSIEVTG